MKFLTTRKFLAAHPDLGLSEFCLRNMIRDGLVPGFYSSTRFLINSELFLQQLENAQPTKQKGGKYND